MRTDPSIASIARSLSRISSTLEKIEWKMQPSIFDQIRENITAEDDYCEEPHDHDSEIS